MFDNDIYKKNKKDAWYWLEHFFILAEVYMLGHGCGVLIHLQFYDQIYSKCYHLPTVWFKWIAHFEVDTVVLHQYKSDLAHLSNLYS